jgi:serine/threonine protein kinase, bacterial
MSRMSELLTAGVVSEDDIGAYVRRHATVARQFDHLTQDSGNVSWLANVGGQRLFVKSAGAQGSSEHDGAAPYFDHAGRVRLLRNAAELAGSCSHPALPRLLNVIESPAGPALVYEAAPGDLVHVPADRRRDPGSSYQRFAHLPAEALLGVLDVLIDLHVALAAVGWIAVDLYDGCLIVDFASGSLKVVDLDTYRRGPSINDMGRMFGSSRFMAPEELERGAAIDERTTVFTLGRLVWHFGTRLTEAGESFCGSPEVADVVRRACQNSPADRHSTVAELGQAWVSARNLTVHHR